MTGTNRVRGKGKGLIVQMRDRELLRQLFLMRLADRDQLMVAAGFGSITRTNARLIALYRAGLLRRFFIGFGAGRKALYALSRKGAQLIGVTCRGPRHRQNELLAADFSTLHQLAINDVYCHLRFHPIPVPGVRFHNWLAFTEPLADDLRLIPDGYVEFATPLGIVASFLEVDLGTEELKVWKEKAMLYLQLATSGIFERNFKQTRFRVLVLADSARRLRFIREAVAEITPKIFWFATLDNGQSDRFFAPVWLRPKGMDHQPLFEQPR
jgi:hypothetical protein